MKNLPNNYYDLDGFSQLLECKCEACEDILRNQNTFHLSSNWHPNDAIEKLRPYKGNLYGYSYTEQHTTLPGDLGSTKWLLQVSPAS